MKDREHELDRDEIQKWHSILGIDLFKMIFETSTDLISINGSDGVPLLVNKTWAEKLEYGLTEIQDFNEIVHPGDLETVIQRWMGFLQGKNDFTNIKYRIKRKDGAYLLLDSTANRFQGSGEEFYFLVSRDITEQAKVEDSLIGQTMLFGTVLNSIPDVIGIQDPHHRIIQYNEAGYKMLGMSREEVQGKRCYELIGKADPCSICATSETYVTKKPSRVERYEDTMDIWLDVRAYPVLDENGEIVYVIEHLRDITKEKENQRKLQESEEMFRSLVETTSDWIWEIDSDGNYTYSSPKVLELLGYRPEDIMGMRPTDLMTPEDSRELEVEIGSLISNPRPFYGLRNENIDSKGYRIMLETSGVPIYNTDGSFKGYRGIDRDITERKKAEEELKFRLGFENVLSSISTDFITMPVDDIDKGIDRALERIGDLVKADRSYVFLYRDLGTRMDNTHEWCREGIESAKDNLQDISPRDFYCVSQILDTRKECVISSLDELPSYAEHDREEFKKERIESLVIVPIFLGEQDVGFIGFDSVGKKREWTPDTISLLKLVGEIFVSALVRKNAQEELINERNRAELYLDLLGHDIGNLHQGIHTSLQLAKLSNKDMSRKEFAMSSAQELTNRSIKLVRTVLLLSKLRVKEIEKIPIDVRYYIEQAWETLKDVFPDKKIDLDISCPAESPRIYAEPIISELFFNLIHNGIKFQNGKDAKVEIDVLLLDGRVQISVSDHGPGIPDEMKGHMFQRFKAGGQGSQTGLGLSLVKALMDRYNGTIVVMDRVMGDHSKGALFLLTFPKAK